MSQKEACKVVAPSPLRRNYSARLVWRCCLLVACVLLWIYRPGAFGILEGMNFFKEFSLFHIVWVIWVLDMLYQIFPLQKKLPLGSQKLFAQRFKPIREKINRKALAQYIRSTTQAAYKVMILWVLLIAAIGVLYFNHVINRTALLIITVVFYVCDLICVLIWCPFRLILRNRCCTTCRIFNWDHLMMFSPLIFINSFFTLSLFLLSLAAFIVWEICILLFPQRFWEYSNDALKCSNCTDKLCTQYCQKLR